MEPHHRATVPHETKLKKRGLPRALPPILLFLMVALSIFGVIKSQGVPDKAAKARGPLEGKTIVLDAGHGGFDGGATGSLTGVLESPINLAIAKYLQMELQEAGAVVLMTRDEEKALASTKRADMEKRRDIIAQEGIDAAISIHLNCFPDSAPNGPHVFYYKGSAAGERLAQCVQASLDNVLERQPRETKEGDYYVLRAGETTSVLVECGFLSNPTDEANLVLPTYQQLLAAAIAKGITDYFMQPPVVPSQSNIVSKKKSGQVF